MNSKVINGKSVQFFNNESHFLNPTLKEKIEIMEIFLPLYLNKNKIPLYELGITQDFSTGYVIVDINFFLY